MAIEIIIQPANRTGTYRAYLNDNLLCNSRQPFFDGARALLRLGYPADLLVTMRHHDRAYPSFKPVSIGEAAGLSVVENAGKGPLLAPFEVYPIREKRKQEKQAARRTPSERQGGTVQTVLASLAT